MMAVSLKKELINKCSNCLAQSYLINSQNQCSDRSQLFIPQSAVCCALPSCKRTLYTSTDHLGAKSSHKKHVDIRLSRYQRTSDKKDQYLIDISVQKSQIKKGAKLSSITSNNCLLDSVGKFNSQRLFNQVLDLHLQAHCRNKRNRYYNTMESQSPSNRSKRQRISNANEYSDVELVLDQSGSPGRESVGQVESVLTETVDIPAQVCVSNVSDTSSQCSTPSRINKVAAKPVGFMSPGSKKSYQYVSLARAFSERGPGVEFNVCGVLIRTNFRNDLVTIKDDTGVELEIYIRNYTASNCILNYRHCDILRFHRIMYSAEYGKYICSAVKDVVVFRAFIPISTRRTQTIFNCKNPTISSADYERAYLLDEWYATQLQDHSLTNLRRGVQFVNLFAQVLSIKHIFKNISCICVWDTKRPGISLANQYPDPLPQIEYKTHPNFYQVPDDLKVFVSIYDMHVEDLKSIKPGDYVFMGNLELKQPRFSTYFLQLNGNPAYSKGIRLVPIDSNLGQVLQKRIYESKIVKEVQASTDVELDDSFDVNNVDLDEMLQAINAESSGQSKLNILPEELQPKKFNQRISEFLHDVHRHGSRLEERNHELSNEQSASKSPRTPKLDFAQNNRTCQNMNCCHCYLRSASPWSTSAREPSQTNTVPISMSTYLEKARDGRSQIVNGYILDPFPGFDQCFVISDLVFVECQDCDFRCSLTSYAGSRLDDFLNSLRTRRKKLLATGNDLRLPCKKCGDRKRTQMIFYIILVLGETPDDAKMMVELKGEAAERVLDVDPLSALLTEDGEDKIRGFYQTIRKESSGECEPTQMRIKITRRAGVIYQVGDIEIGE